MTQPRYFALIPAAGVGARMGSVVPKQYGQIAGKSLLQYVMETFAATPEIEHGYVVVSPEDAYIASLPAVPRTTILFCGGATRQASVTNGLAAMAAEVKPEDWVLVHDAARPGLTVDLIVRLIAAVSNDPVGGLLALPVADTVKRSNAEGRALETVPRDRLWAAQTPQMFRHAALLDALRKATEITDEASAFEALGLQPRLVEGSARNFKVTRPEDMLLAERYLKGSA
jgi:2-C-methyl-D-erythritol 4-phosphate cytidylyltransferase